MQNDGMEQADLCKALVFVCTTARCHTKYDIILTVNSNFTSTHSLHDLGVKRPGKGMLRHDLSMTRVFTVSCSMHGCHLPHYSNVVVVASKAHASNTRGIWQLRACISTSPVATRGFATRLQSQLHVLLQLKKIIAVPP